MLFICEKLILIKKNIENKNKNNKNKNTKNIKKKHQQKKRGKKRIEVKNRYSNKNVSRNSYFINLSNN